MLRRLLLPVAIALVAACSGSGTQSVSWGHRSGVWAACYFTGKGTCLDFLDPENTAVTAELRSDCMEDDGLWYEAGTCPETQLGSCEIPIAKTVLRYYRSTDLSKGEMACGYASGLWTTP